MNRRWTGRFWSAPVIWHFALGCRGSSKSARGLAHSKTLSRGRRFKGSKRELSVGRILTAALARWEREKREPAQAASERVGQFPRADCHDPFSQRERARVKIPRSPTWRLDP